MRVERHVGRNCISAPPPSRFLGYSLSFIFSLFWLVVYFICLKVLISLPKCREAIRKAHDARNHPLYLNWLTRAPFKNQCPLLYCAFITDGWCFVNIKVIIGSNRPSGIKLYSWSLPVPELAPKERILLCFAVKGDACFTGRGDILFKSWGYRFLI